MTNPDSRFIVDEDGDLSVAAPAPSLVEGLRAPIEGTGAAVEYLRWLHNEAAIELERLEAALEKYGQHKEVCPKAVSRPRYWPENSEWDKKLCTCGLTAALAGKEVHASD